MKKKLICIFIIMMFFLLSIGIVSAEKSNQKIPNYLKNSDTQDSIQNKNTDTTDSYMTVKGFFKFFGEDEEYDECYKLMCIFEITSYTGEIIPPMPYGTYPPLEEFHIWKKRVKENIPIIGHIHYIKIEAPFP